jgi:cellulose biosynthesis protein BcsQ
MSAPIKSYAFFNNKGGVGKTTLCGHTVVRYAELHPERQVLAIIQSQATRRNVVGFIEWLLRGNSGFSKPAATFRTQVSRYNSRVPSNLYLIAGDSFLESLALALNYAVLNPANTYAWSEFMTAFKRLFPHEHDAQQYKEMCVFVDCNPSFSVYTQMALVSVDHLVVPMMADYSSAEGIKSILMMLYGKYPSAALQTYASTIVTFHKQVSAFGLRLPTIYEFVFNNFTANLGVANAFAAVRDELISFCYDQYVKFPALFTPASTPPTDKQSWTKTYVSDVKDFHTAGKVAAALGIPITSLPRKTTYRMPSGKTVKLPTGNYEQAVADVENLVRRLA